MPFFPTFENIVFFPSLQKTWPLGKLLTHPGCVELKSLCFQNLHLEAHSADENSTLQEFLEDAQTVKQSLKAK